MEPDQNYLKFNNYTIHSHGAFIKDSEGTIIKEYMTSLVPLLSSNQHTMRKIIEQLGKYRSPLSQNLSYRVETVSCYVILVEVFTNSELAINLLLSELESKKTKGIVYTPSGHTLLITCGIKDYIELAKDFLIKKGVS